MKKVKWMLSLLLVVALTACGSGESAASQSAAPGEADSVPSATPAASESVESADPWGVSLTVSNVTAMGCTYTFTQSGGEPSEDLGYGSEFSVQRKDGNDWVTVEELPLPDGIQRGWTLLLYPIPQEGSVSDDIGWSDLYGVLPAGDYRLCKEVQRGRGETLEERMYYAEFLLIR